jgi:hypothetical protein
MALPYTQTPRSAIPGTIQKSINDLEAVEVTIFNRGVLDAYVFDNILTSPAQTIALYYDSLPGKWRVATKFKANPTSQYTPQFLANTAPEWDSPTDAIYGLNAAGYINEVIAPEQQTAAITASQQIAANAANNIRISGVDFVLPPPIKYEVHTPSVGEFEGEGTYFKIGPHVYGGEVQSINIIEDKAVKAFRGVRSNSDFLVEEGKGDADVEVTMLFKNIRAIIDHFVPLVALFRVSPITTVKNSVINNALLNKFTENQAEKQDQLAFDKYENLITKAYNDIKETYFAEHLGISKTIVTEDIFNTQKAGAIFKHGYHPVFSRWPTFSEYQNDSQTFLAYESFAHDSLFGESEDSAAEVAKKTPSLPHPEAIDYVSMAIMGIRVETHPEFPEAIVARVFLKRIDTSNYVRNSLVYRTLSNAPTTDASKCYWLRRALDIYIDKYLGPEWIKNGNGRHPEGGVSLQFAGDDIYVKLFKEQYELEGLVVNKGGDSVDHPTGTVVTQMSYSIGNKFALHKLQGRSYPTAQYMGATSGTFSISVRTNDPEKFEAIHQYKSAADFFVRTADRLDRFNGWQVNCILARLFNIIEIPEANAAAGAFSPTSYYPMSVVSSTNNDSPGLRDISMTFAESNPQFFQDFGFTVAKGGFTLENFREFTKELWDRALTYRLIMSTGGYADVLTASTQGRQSFLLDSYAHDVIFGEGRGVDEFCLLNPDTIAAAFLEDYKYKDQSIDYDDTVNSARDQIFDELARNDKFSGVIDTPRSLRDILARDALGLFTFWQDIEIRTSVGETLVDLFFEVEDRAVLPGINYPIGFSFDEETAAAIRNAENKRATLISRVIDFPEADGRRSLYRYIHNNPDILFTEEFFERLFAAVVRRKESALGNKIFDVSGLINAYNAMALAIENKGREILGDNFANALGRSKRDEKKIFIDPGHYRSTTTAATCFPDFPHITYEEMFDIGGLWPNNWYDFAPTYQNVGILNNDPEKFQTGFSASNVDNAQRQPVATADSPIPPSFCFFSENELDLLRDRIDEEYGDWFDKQKQLRLKIPFDMEMLLEDSFKNNSSGQRVTINGNRKGMASIIEDMVSDTLKKVGRDQFNTATEDIIIHHANKYAVSHGLQSAADLRSANKVESFAERFKEMMDSQYDAEYTGELGEGISVPFLSSTYIGSDVMRWIPLSSVYGDKLVRTIVRASSAGIDANLDQFIDSTLVREAAGLNSGLTLSTANEEETRVAMLKATQAIKDDSNDMIKAFPVMRLYLIDFIGPRIIVQDNFYGYHAIQSIDITLDKEDAALAVIRLADPFHVLQGSTFDSEYKKGASAIDDIVLPGSVDDIKKKDIMNRLKLKQGRAIQIRGGYSSDPDNLDILFTGRISELQFGDVVTIVAQGWKAELLGRQITMQLNNRNESSIKDLVVNTIRGANPAGIGDQYSRSEAQRLYELSGLSSTELIVRQSLIAGSGTRSPHGVRTGAFSAGPSGMSPLGFAVFKEFGKGLDLRLKNIWVPDKDRTRWGYFADISDTGWDGYKWTVPLQQSWQVLQSATNYIPGYICQVVPFDGEATLFFGRPEQMYFYTAGNNFQQRVWNEARAESISTIEENMSALLHAFYRSNSFATSSYILNHISDEVRDIDVEGDQGFFSGHALLKLNIGSTVRVDAFSQSMLSMVAIDNWFTSNADYFGGRGWVRRDNKLRKEILNRSFAEEFYSIKESLGSQGSTAVLLISHFFGIDYRLLSDNPNTSEILREMLRPNSHDRAPLRKLLQQIANKVSDESRAVNTLLDNIANIPRATVESYLSTIGKPHIKDSLRSLTTNIELDSGTIKSDDGGFTIKFGGSVGRAAGSTRVALEREVETALDAMVLYMKRRFLSDTRVIRTSNPYLFPISEIQVFHNPGQLANNKLEERLLANIQQNGGIDFLIEETIEFLNQSIRLHEEVENKRKIGFNKNQSSVLSKIGHTYIDFSDSSWVEHVVNTTPLFRVFVYFFSDFINRSVITGEVEEETLESVESIKQNHVFDYNSALNMKVFRDYHSIRSGVDIIENNIAASTREMHNTVAIRYPQHLETSTDRWYDRFPLIGSDNENFVSTTIGGETTWETWPFPEEQGHIGMQFSPEITLQDKKVAVYTDLNVRRRDQAALVATNVLTKMMRPMYRNNLKIMGRSIKPWDYIILSDNHIDMYGIIDVERVVHHYSPEDGWCTNIVPHLVCEANPGNRYVQAALVANRVDKVQNLVDYILWGSVALTLVPAAGPAITAAHAASRTAIRTVLGVPAKFSRSRLIRGIVPNRVGTALGQAETLGAKIGAKTSGINLSQQLKALGGNLRKAAPSTLNSILWGPALTGYGANAISRYLIRNSNAGVGETRGLPVIMVPLIYKGAPLEAGLAGEDTIYWSLASRSHYGWKDFTDGVGTLWDIVTSGFTPNSTRTENVLKSWKILDTNGIFNP